MKGAFNAAAARVNAASKFMCAQSTLEGDSASSHYIKEAQRHSAAISQLRRSFCPSPFAFPITIS